MVVHSSSVLVADRVRAEVTGSGHTVSDVSVVVHSSSLRCRRCRRRSHRDRGTPCPTYRSWCTRCRLRCRPCRRRSPRIGAHRVRRIRRGALVVASLQTVSAQKSPDRGTPCPTYRSWCTRCRLRCRRCRHRSHRIGAHRVRRIGRGALVVVFVADGVGTEVTGSGHTVSDVSVVVHSLSSSLQTVSAQKSPGSGHTVSDVSVVVHSWSSSLQTVSAQKSPDRGTPCPTYQSWCTRRRLRCRRCPRRSHRDRGTPYPTYPSWCTRRRLVADGIGTEVPSGTPCGFVCALIGFLQTVRQKSSGTRPSVSVRTCRSLRCTSRQRRRECPDTVGRRYRC